MKKQKGCSLIGLLVVVSIVSVLILVIAGAYESPEEKQVIYSAWVKANPNVQLTFDEWELLRDKEMLPGQVKSSSNGVATGVAVGLAAGMAAGRR